MAEVIDVSVSHGANVCVDYYYKSSEQRKIDALPRLRAAHELPVGEDIAYEIANKSKY